MNFMLTFSGAEYFLDGDLALVPGNKPIREADLCHQLSLINRFNGATRRPYSVAEHSLLVSEIAQREGAPLVVQLAALLHDAHEIYTQDMIQPIKTALNNRSLREGGHSVYRAFEQQHALHLRSHYGLLTVFRSAREALHRYDMQALATERRDLMTWTQGINLPWDALGDTTDAPALKYKPIDWIRLDTPEREAMHWRHWRGAFANQLGSLRFGLRGTAAEQQANQGLA